MFHGLNVVGGRPAWEFDGLFEFCYTPLSNWQIHETFASGVQIKQCFNGNNKGTETIIFFSYPYENNVILIVSLE